ncbi:MAG: hypothetical protein IT180_03320 [Acidobacteria bacterium]|nr:hypothetical protein [Acidobacteriota bacterium]
MDVHVVPHHLADIEAAVLAGCALGVPTITTDFGAAAELLGSRARLVPPCALTYASDGQCVALIDAGLALHELRTLTGPSSVRAAEGHGGPTVALAPDFAALAEWRQQVEWMWATA